MSVLTAPFATARGDDLALADDTQRVRGPSSTAASTS